MNSPPPRPASGFLARLAHRAAELQNAPRAKPQPKPVKPAPPPPLIDQIRSLLATMPANQREKLHIPMIVPHLQGRYRERPHMLRVAAALKQLGYRQIRVWSGADAGRRFWIPTTPK